MRRLLRLARSAAGRLVRRLTGDAGQPAQDPMSVPEDHAFGPHYVPVGCLSPEITDRIIEWQLNRSWTPVEFMVQIMAQVLLNPNDQVLDGGAHVGMHTEGFARRVLPHGIVHAVEASPDILPRLRESLAEAGWPNVVIHPVAISDTEGAMEFFAYPDHPALSGLALARASGLPDDEPVVRTIVQVRTIDLLLSEWRAASDSPSRPLALIKLDVEGFEFPALRGAAELLARERPYIIMEHSRERDLDADEVLEWLYSLGYDLFDNFFRPLPGSDLSAVTDLFGRVSLNLLAAPVEKREQTLAAQAQFGLIVANAPLERMETACRRHFRPRYW